MSQSRLTKVFLKNLRSFLSERGMKKKVAETLNVNPAIVSMLLNSNGEVELGTVEKYSKALNISVAKMLGIIEQGDEFTLHDAIKVIEGSYNVSMGANPKKGLTFSFEERDVSSKARKFYKTWGPYQKEIAEVLKEKVDIVAGGSGDKLKTSGK